jgi:Fur family transcriptional regulator, iron response regulator
MKAEVEAVLPARAQTGCDEIVRQVRHMYGEKQERPGCPINAVKAQLKRSGLRPTRQRVMLGWMLFGQGHRHVAAEDLFAEVTRARGHLSLATVYNTLNQFTEAGLLRQVQAGPGKAYYDTNTSDHQHFAVEGEGLVFDIESEPLALKALPQPPEGFEIAGVDVVVRLKRLRKS